MCKVNFVSEFNMMMRHARNNGLSGRERLLWMALFAIANDRANYNAQTQDYDWPEGLFPVPNGELSLYSTLDKRGIETIRNSLKQRGLIDFTPGVKNKRPPAYKMRYLSINVGYKSVPNDVPNHDPNDVPNHDPNDVPNHDPNDVPNHDPIPININTKANATAGYGADDVPHHPGLPTAPTTRELAESFVPPTVEMVAEYCCAQGLKINADYFVSYYDAHGWMVGNKPMLEWTMHVRRWAENEWPDKRPEWEADIAVAPFL